MATPPAGPVQAPALQLAMSGLLARALFSVTERGILDLLPEGPLGSAEIAGKTGAHPAAMHQVADPFPETLDTGWSGVEPAFGEPWFEHLHARSEQAASFNRMMVGIHGTEPAAVAQASDFTGIGHLVGVGGGIGTLLRAVLEANPGLRGTLFDLPGVVDQARENPAGLGERSAVATGGFFDGVPAGADAYLLSHVVHDWDEAECRTIL
ncbi:methyltransferase [Pseudonocardia acidicola]|uniref:O-methyltransferase C-terminal domain-containing protein n=1 Tax=Pseudonocardia acidicola TaxID=2724939 RepID=A0ABX1SD99_9PSEU|nr:methyltransferase [Pseudonocardia acidicola]NMH99550.1 hypothetical protein [Pseudonocardia acidicola]